MVSQGQEATKIENAFLWRDGKFKNIGALPVRPLEDVMAGVAYAINNKGVVVGGSGSFGAGPMDGLMFCSAFVYNNGDLGDLLPGEPGTVKESEQAFGINDRGTVVGSEAFHGFVFLDGKQIEIVPLSTLEEGNGTVGVAVNNNNEVVGATATGKVLTHPKIHAFLWKQPGVGILLDLGTLPGFRNSIAMAISDDETIVGYTSKASEDSAAGGKWVGNRDPKTLDFDDLPRNGHAFVWHHGVVRDLGVLPDGPQYSAAFGINKQGMIVGTSGDRAVVWVNGVAHDLNSMIAKGSGWTLVQARAINGRGWIVGWGTISGQDRAYLLIPKMAGSVSFQGDLNLAR